MVLPSPLSWWKISSKPLLHLQICPQRMLSRGACQRGMRPARISGPAQWVAPVHRSEVKVSSAVRPLSAEVAEFSPALVREKKVESGWTTKSSGAGGAILAVVADPPVPTVEGATFTAVAEVHVSTSATEDDSSVLLKPVSSTLFVVEILGKFPRPRVSPRGTRSAPSRGNSWF